MPGSGGNRLSEPGEVTVVANRSGILEDDEKGTAHGTSQARTEQNQDPDSFRTSTYVFVADEHVADEFVATADGSSSFDTDDVHAGATILTVITDICKRARKPSSEERGQLHTLFELMPYPMTREAREQQGEDLMSAFQFLITLYDSPDSTDWGAIESFDHLQVQLEMLEKFDSRAEAEPKEAQEGEFVV
ncbi:hypothetical protein NW768_005705 [Fusarium equiseti]|uniref:Uncharacterized protein n=1 Tax=Fusarium equiseti TaxID=61235 RepID=A0ABQ8RCW2_FUSEQ|nr:hypothetical protein NW768_005705 [Fusarium equiseti]